MQIKVGHKKAVEINDDVIRDILGIYPEEELIYRPFFEKGFSDGHISYNGLVKECGAIHVPWQMFFFESKKS